MKKKKKKNKKEQYYKCELCGGIKTYLFAFCACPECDKILRKHMKHYREYREELEGRYRRKNETDT